MNSTPTPRTAPIFAQLNGWRRIGIVLVCAWLIVAAIVSWRAPQEVAAAFPSLAEPVMGTRLVPAPELGPELETAKIRKLGRELKPWEKEWNPTRQVQVQLAKEDLPGAVRWLLLFGVPLLAWFFVELLVRVVLWVRAGFETRAAPSD